MEEKLTKKKEDKKKKVLLLAKPERLKETIFGRKKENLLLKPYLTEKTTTGAHSRQQEISERGQESSGNKTGKKVQDLVNLKLENSPKFRSKIKLKENSKLKPRKVVDSASPLRKSRSTYFLSTNFFVAQDRTKFVPANHRRGEMPDQELPGLGLDTPTTRTEFGPIRDKIKEKGGRVEKQKK